MPISAIKRLKQETIFNFLNQAFYATYQSMVDQGMVTKTDLNFEIFKDQADYDGTILVPMYAEDDDAQKINYGLFRFIGGDVDPSELFTVYLQRHAFEMLAFEEYREDIKEIFTTFAASLDGNSFEISDGNATTRAFFEVNQFPDMTQTIDADGADKFIISITINILFYYNIIHSIDNDLRLNGTQVSYAELVFNRKMMDPAADLRKGYDMKFAPTRSAFSIALTGYYTADGASSVVADWIVDETKLSEPIRLYYNDGFKVKTGVYLVADAKLTVPFEAISAWSLTLMPYRDQEQQYYGLLVTNSAGSGEYQVGQTIELFNDDDFSHWEIQPLTTNQTIIDYINSIDTQSEQLIFTMPACDLKITSIKN